MSATDQVLSEFIDAWNAGNRPRVRDYLARLPDGPDRDTLLKRWSDEVQFARDHASSGGCMCLVSFPGPRPWTPSACKLLGVESTTDAHDP